MPKTPPESPAKPPAKTPAARRKDTPQRDLFQLDSPLIGEIRGERSLMAFPFFALAKSAWMKPLAYHHGPISIEVRPSANGVATIYDKEIVLYIASLMAAKLEAGEEVAQDFVFTAHDLFSVTGSNHSARSYQRLSEALERLQGTQIKTNIEAGGEGEEGFFSWLSEARLHYSKTRAGEKRLKAVKVRLCDWLYRAILRDRQVLDYAAAYFQLGPIERRIYEVARANAPGGGPWVGDLRQGALGQGDLGQGALGQGDPGQSEAAEGNRTGRGDTAPGDDDRLEVDLATFRLQIGYQNPLANFRTALKQIAGTDIIPDYDLALIEGETPAAGAAPGTGRGRKAAPVSVVITRRRAPAANDPGGSGESGGESGAATRDDPAQ